MAAKPSKRQCMGGRARGLDPSRRRSAVPKLCSAHRLPNPSSTSSHENEGDGEPGSRSSWSTFWSRADRVAGSARGASWFAEMEPPRPTYRGTRARRRGAAPPPFAVELQGTTRIEIHVTDFWLDDTVGDVRSAVCRALPSALLRIGRGRGPLRRLTVGEACRSSRCGRGRRGGSRTRSSSTPRAPAGVCRTTRRRRGAPKADVKHGHGHRDRSVDRVVTDKSGR